MKRCKHIFWIILLTYSGVTAQTEFGIAGGIRANAFQIEFSEYEQPPYHLAYTHAEHIQVGIPWGKIILRGTLEFGRMNFNINTKHTEAVWSDLGVIRSKPHGVGIRVLKVGAEYPIIRSEKQSLNVGLGAGISGGSNFHRITMGMPYADAINNEDYKIAYYLGVVKFNSHFNYSGNFTLVYERRLGDCLKFRTYLTSSLFLNQLYHIEANYWITDYYPTAERVQITSNGHYAEMGLGLTYVFKKKDKDIAQFSGRGYM